MIQYKKILMTLALLLTAATGAWADGVTMKEITSSDIQSSWNGNTDPVKATDLPGFKAMTHDEAIALGAPSNNENVYLIYAINASNKFAALIYESGTKSSNETEFNLNELQSTAQNYWVYYTYSDAPAEPDVEVTTNAASEQDLFTTASFKMPTFDATVNYMLVRDMQDETNPVIFSGLPTNDEPIIVKKGDDGKYQPAEALTIQLIDPLAAAEAQNIIAADGITIKVLVGAENELGAIDYDQDNPITLEAFLADMKPGYYWIKAEQTDEDSPYDGTVYSSEFTAVEKYDLTVKPANDFSKGKIESVTVGTESVTIDANTGEATKTGIAPDTEVKLKAKRGYVIEKVEVKKGGPTKTIKIEGIELIYSEGDTWEKIVEKNPDLYIEHNKIWSRTEKAVLSVGQDSVLPSDIIDPSKEYWWDY